MNIIEISDYNITLDLSWLRKHELNINYKKRTVIFNNRNYTFQLEIEEILLEEITRQFQSNSDLVRLAMIKLNNTKVNYIIAK
jgi:hypothetical protein